MRRTAVLGLFLACLASAQEPGEEILYNGIRLASPWPPKGAALPAELPAAPYLAAPPAVIPIDVGRQLFVDDFLVQETTLQRAFHSAKYHEASPVLRPDQPWEGDVAMAFSDGAWYDPKDRLFKMWYMAGPDRDTCLATSEDGLRWKKPALDVKPGTNVVHVGFRDSSTVWLDHEEADPARRFKMFRTCSGGVTLLATFYSGDGIHWSDKLRLSGPCGDRTTVYWNPFRKVWVYSIRGDRRALRYRRYWERADLEKSPMWRQIVDPPPWIAADALDPPRPEYKVPCELYTLDAVAYESLLLGLFTIWRGQFPDRQKPNEICLGYSRDGLHWTRPDRRPLCPVSDRQGEWNANNVQSVGGACLVVGDQLWFYVSGRAGERGSDRGGVSTTGLAILRRDGFASMDAGADGGTLTTRPVRFSGRELFVNLAAPRGELLVEVLDENGGVRFRSLPVSGDGTKLRVTWSEGDPIAAAAGRPVRFRFRLKNGSLYSFWVSPDASGASRGYVAAGGPGFAGPTDTAGAK